MNTRELTRTEENVNMLTALRPKVLCPGVEGFTMLCQRPEAEQGGSKLNSVRPGKKEPVGVEEGLGDFGSQGRATE